MRLIALPYALICYLIGFATIAYLIFFIGDLIVPWTINQPSPLAPVLNTVIAAAWNVFLIFAWGMQHSIMADPAFKAKWTRIIPPAIERSTYVLTVAFMTGLLITFWVPLPHTLWDFSEQPLGIVLLVGFGLGWGIAILATFLINHFHLFGVVQALEIFRKTPGEKMSFVTPFLYKVVRHPMMTGILIALWCAPTLTLGRLIFNIAMTIYVIVGTRHEEKALVADLGQQYKDYQKTTPGLIPRFFRRK